MSLAEIIGESALLNFDRCGSATFMMRSRARKTWSNPIIICEMKIYPMKAQDMAYSEMKQ